VLFLEHDPLLYTCGNIWDPFSFFRVLSYARITYMFRVWQGDDLVEDKI